MDERERERNIKKEMYSEGLAHTVKEKSHDLPPMS